MSRYSTPLRSRLWKKFAIMHSLQVRKPRTHLPTAAQPLARSQMSPYVRLVGRDGLTQFHGRDCGVKILMGGRHKLLPAGDKLFDFQLQHKSAGSNVKWRNSFRREK